MKIKEIRILRNRFEDVIQDDIDIDQGCCFFHDQREFTQFTDIDDDNIDDVLD